MSENIVVHKKYGRGIVQYSRHNGFESKVIFEDGLTRWVRIEDLTESISYQPIRSEQNIPQSMSDNSFRYRRMIEAFRLGIVPYDCVEEFTFGRDRETQILAKWLNESDESLLFVIGEYGTGKSHLLHYLYGRALQDGFAVAYVEIDPHESPFHKPKRVYGHLIRDFRFRSKKDRQLKGFRDFLKDVIASGAFKDHRYFKYLIDNTSDENLWNWIEGSESISRVWVQGDIYDRSYTQLPGLYDYSTAANIYCYLLSSIGWAAKEVLGLKGLLLVFDEAEAINNNYSNYRYDRSLNFLNALRRTASNEITLLNLPYYEEELDYCLKGEGRCIPFLYRQPCSMKLLFAFTPIESFRWLFEINKSIELESLTDVALRNVFEQIRLIYDGAYNYLGRDTEINAIFSKMTVSGSRTRSFVKGSVEALDLSRLGDGFLK